MNDTKNLDEAIDHARDMAQEHKGTPCGDEHTQLLKWLQELQNWRSLMKNSKPTHTESGG